jgi:hypothetical protein
MSSTTSAPAASAVAQPQLSEAGTVQAPHSFKFGDSSMQTLRASLKELEKTIVRQLSTPLYIYFTQLYDAAREEVKAGKTQCQGRYADLRWFQEKLREIPKYNTDQIAAATKKVLDYRPSVKFNEILKTVFYLKSMILASIRPDTNEEVFVGIPTTETYMHRVLSIVAERIFAYPSLMRRYKDDSEETVVANREHLNAYIVEGIVNAIIDLVPTGEIINKYVSRAMDKIKTEDKREIVDDMQRYGFEDHKVAGDMSGDEDEAGDYSETDALTDDESDNEGSEMIVDDEDGGKYDYSETDDEEDYDHHGRHRKPDRKRVEDKRDPKRVRKDAAGPVPPPPQQQQPQKEKDIKEIPKAPRQSQPPNPNLRPTNQSDDDADMSDARPQRPSQGPGMGARTGRGEHMPRTSQPRRRHH